MLQWVSFLLLPCLLCQVSTADSMFDWAAHSVPPAFDRVLWLLPELRPTTGPGDIKSLRVALLDCRELLDIFSWVYPNISTQWEAVRRDLDAGYEVLGDFQDLDHSGVNYTQVDEVERRGACLAWQAMFLGNLQSNEYHEFVSAPVNGSLYRHHHTSRLFWGYGGVEPVATTTGLLNLAALVRDSQIRQALDTPVVELRHIHKEPNHSRFHTFRKLIRSILAVLQHFPQLLPAKQPPDSVSAFCQGASDSPTTSGRESNHIARLVAGSTEELVGALVAQDQVPQAPCSHVAMQPCS
ncbi:hypothetical protein V8C86DRAFT_2823067 [Haematococcus lacustris]